MFFVAFQVFECAGQGVLRDNSPVVTPRPHSTGKPVFRQTAGRNTFQQVYDFRHVRAVRLEQDMHVRSPDVNCFQGAVLVMSNLDESATQEIPLPFVESHAPFALASCAFENCLVVLQIIEVAAVGISFRWRDVVFVFARAESARVAGKPRPVSRPRYQIPRMRHAIIPQAPPFTAGFPCFPTVYDGVFDPGLKTGAWVEIMGQTCRQYIIMCGKCNIVLRNRHAAWLGIRFDGEGSGVIEWPCNAEDAGHKS